MDCTKRLLALLIAGCVVLLTTAGQAEAIAPPPPQAPAGLAIVELKVTGEEFIVLQNNTGATLPDLSKYWLQAFNATDPLAGGTSQTSQQLPAAALGAGQSLLLSSQARATCGAALAGKLSVPLTDSGGFLQVVQAAQGATGAVSQTAGDHVSWSSGSSGQITGVPSSSKDPLALYYRYAAGSGFSWQLADADSDNACQLNALLSSGQTPGKQPVTLANDSAPARFVASTSTVPAANAGLSAPEITELLPNPAGTGTDSTDEYIELYNPNATPFDLSGYQLVTGTTVRHTYAFPAGTSLLAKSFASFYSADSGLTLSNTKSQAQLLDPQGNSLAQTDVYENAKDGQAWALAAGKWYWTLTPTPEAANVITLPPAKNAKAASAAKAKSSQSTTAKKSGTVKGAATSSGQGASSGLAPAALMTPLHPWVLALVASGAVLYGAYEYRADLANYFSKFRRHPKPR